MSNICSNFTINPSVWNGKIFIFGSCTAGCCCFICNRVHPLCCFINRLLLILLYWSTNMHYIYQDFWTFFQEEVYLPIENILNFSLIIIYHIPPLFIESERICFGKSSLLRLAIVKNGRYVIRNNLHAMGGICKEGWHWYFLIKF